MAVGLYQALSHFPHINILEREIKQGLLNICFAMAADWIIDLAVDFFSHAQRTQICCLYLHLTNFSLF